MPASWQKVAEFEPVAVADGFMVYDEQRDCAHYLNATAALVLVLCDGRNALEEMADAIQGLFALETPPEREIALVLDRLVEEGLVLAPDDVVASGA